MSGMIAKFVGKKILNETLQNKFGTEVSVAPMFTWRVLRVLTIAPAGSVL